MSELNVTRLYLIDFNTIHDLIISPKLPSPRRRLVTAPVRTLARPVSTLNVITIIAP